MMTLGLAGTAGAAQTVTTMVPLIGVSRRPLPDIAFIKAASRQAIATMNAAQREISRARIGGVQIEAVRTFNTAADAYNALADLAAQRRLQVAAPSSIFQSNGTPPIADDGLRASPADFAFANGTQTSLIKEIALYRDEMRTGKDPAVLAFATKMEARLEHDLDLATIDIQHLDQYGERSTDPETIQ